MNLSKVFAGLVYFVSISSNALAADATPPEVTIDGLQPVHEARTVLR